MEIDWWTLALQAVNFLVLVWLLQRFLYRPVRAVLEKRKALAERALAEAEEKQRQADAERSGLQADRAGLAGERQKLLRDVHAELDAERARLLDAAHAEAERLIADARETVAQERAAALADVKSQAARAASDIAASLLRNSDLPGAADAAIERLEQTLRDLPPEETEQLLRQLAEPDAAVTVTTAAALSPETQARWRDRLAAVIGQPDRIRFAVLPAIVGGAELHFPHAVIGHSWAQQLETARKAMIGDDDPA